MGAEARAIGPKPTTTRVREFTLPQACAALIRSAGYYEGFWRLTFEFGPVRAANIQMGPMIGTRPASFTPIMALSIRRVESIDDELTVDAAAVNPRPRIIVAG